MYNESMIRLIGLEVSLKKEQTRFSELLSNMFSTLESNSKRHSSELQNVLNQLVLPIYIDINQNQVDIDLIKIAIQTEKELQEQCIALKKMSKVTRHKRRCDDDSDTREKKKKKEVPYADRNRFYSSIAKPCDRVYDATNSQCGQLTNNRIGRLVICKKCIASRNKYICIEPDCTKSPAYDNHGVLRSRCENCGNRCFSCNEINEYASSKTCSKCQKSKTCTMCQTRCKVIDEKNNYLHSWCEECYINK